MRNGMTQPNMGKVDVYIDGVLAQADLDAYAPRVTKQAVLYQPCLKESIILMELYSSFTFGDITAQYWRVPETRQIGLTLVPSSLADQAANASKQYAIDSLVQIKLVGDDYPGGFAHGRTMRNSASVAKFLFMQQEILQTEGGTETVITRLVHEQIPHLKLEHKLCFFKGFPALELHTEIINESQVTVDIEMLSSFSIGGIELENCGPLAEAYTWEKHLLQRDGVPITSGQRRFWNFRDPFVIDYLSEKVIRFLKKYDFGYLKIDYNETIGIGCDGAESLGEGLRLQMEAVQSFMGRIRSELPHLVIENCSSGGHRLEPSMMGLTSMASFSDAHEEPEIPIIAANMHRVILPRQSQIWAVLRKGDSVDRLRYSMVNTFLGRMCLSGDIRELNDDQWRIVDEGMRFYQQIAPLIKDGISYRFGTNVESYRHPQGWQCMLRMNREGTEGAAILHTFGGELPEQVEIRLPTADGFQIADVYADNLTAILNGNILSFSLEGNFTAAAVLLRSQPTLNG